ncbi:MAG: hypothetical protein ABEL51_14360 [Salinibacter sp.]
MAVEDQRYREAARAIQTIRDEVRWKSKKDVDHLAKRKSLGHLSQDATVGDYNGVIGHLVSQPDHRVYLYVYGKDRYYGVRGAWHGAEWLALFSSNGIMETAFPPAAMDDYLDARGFVELGTLREVMSWIIENG